MNKIIYDIELQPIQQNENVNDYHRKYTEQIKTKRDKIKLSLYCAKYCFTYNNATIKSLVQQCIVLIEKCLIDPNSVIKQDLLNEMDKIDAVNDYVLDRSDYAARTTSAAAEFTADCSFYYSYDKNLYLCLCFCSKIPNINMNLPHQYLQTLLRTTKQFNIENQYSNHIEQIVKQDIDKLELVDYNMLLDISNEHYNIDLSEFCYENIFSRRNLIELIRREYLASKIEKVIVP